MKYETKLLKKGVTMQRNNAISSRDIETDILLDIFPGYIPSLRITRILSFDIKWKFLISLSNYH